MHGDVTDPRGRSSAPRAGYLKSLAVQLLGGSALVAAALTVPGAPAQAQCVPAAADGVVATCSGVTVNQGPGTGIGYGEASLDDVTVNVLPGASVTGTNTGIELGLNATVDNDGTISGETDSGVVSLGEIISLTNDGTITGSTIGVFGFNGINDLTNNGTIKAGAAGVAINAGEIGNLINSGTITGETAFGIFASGTINVMTNEVGGTIIGGDEDGVFASGAINSLTNRGTIRGDNNGVRTITITSLINSGTITGENDDGVFADIINSLVNSGTIRGNDIGVFANTITSLINESGGLITSANFAIFSSNGDDTVDNFGTITGNVDLGSGANAFNNMAGGLFNAGSRVDISGGDLLTNAGTFAPGGIGTIQTTGLTGNLTQTGSGILATDIMFGSLTADLTNVTDTSMLSGQVVPNILNPASVQPGTQQVTILTSAGGVTNAGLTVQDNAVVDYSLLFPDAFTVALGVTVDFSPSGLNQNQTALGEVVNAIQAGGGSTAFAPIVTALLTIPDLAGLADAYDQLGPEIYLDNAIATLFSTLDFTDDLMSCEVREGGNVFINEGQCLWAKGSGAWFDQDTTSETIGFNRDAIRFAGGFQVAVAPDWRLGMAIGYENSRLDALGGRQNSEADTLHGGAAIKYLIGDGLIAAAISGGQGWHDTTRTIAFGGFAGQATASHDVSHLTGRLRGAYAFTNGAHYIKPLVDLNVSWVDIDGFTETGGNGAALIVQGTDETIFSVSPAVEFGWQSALADGILLRPYIRAGVTVFDDPEFALTSSFAAAGGTPGIRTVVGTDDVVADIAAGLDVLATDGSVIKVYYAGQFGEDTTQQSVGARASLKF